MKKTRSAGLSKLRGWDSNRLVLSDNRLTVCRGCQFRHPGPDQTAPTTRETVDIAT